jgi:2-C-methyl-D-erythritol 4-phosphate cytidylyltransferase
MGIETAQGGDSRAASVRNGLAKVKDDMDFVAVHDAARPVFVDAWIDAVFSAAEKHGAAILATPVTSTIKRVVDNRIVDTVARDNLWEAQTPQVFRRDWLVEAYHQPEAESATDDAELLQRLGKQVLVVRASPLNLKITTREDMKMAKMALQALPKPKLNDRPGNPLDDMWR